MKNNYEDFVNDYKALKNRAIDMSETLNKISKHFVNMKQFGNDVIFQIDEDDAQLEYTEYNRCGDDTFYFNIPTKILFSEEECDKYIKNEENKLEQKRLQLEKEKEEKLRKEEEQKRLSEIKKIEDEKKKLKELIEKYPELIKINN